MSRAAGERIGLNRQPDRVAQIGASFHDHRLPADPVDVEAELISHYAKAGIASLDARIPYGGGQAAKRIGPPARTWQIINCSRIPGENRITSVLRRISKEKNVRQTGTVVERKDADGPKTGGNGYSNQFVTSGKGPCVNVCYSVQDCHIGQEIAVQEYVTPDVPDAAGDCDVSEL